MKKLDLDDMFDSIDKALFVTEQMLCDKKDCAEASLAWAEARVKMDDVRHTIIVESVKPVEAEA